MKRLSQIVNYIVFEAILIALLLYAFFGDKISEWIRGALGLSDRQYTILLFVIAAVLIAADLIRNRAKRGQIRTTDYWQGKAVAPHLFGLLLICFLPCVIYTVVSLILRHFSVPIALCLFIAGVHVVFWHSVPPLCYLFCTYKSPETAFASSVSREPQKFVLHGVETAMVGGDYCFGVYRKLNNGRWLHNDFACSEETLKKCYSDGRISVDAAFFVERKSGDRYIRVTVTNPKGSETVSDSLGSEFVRTASGVTAVYSAFLSAYQEDSYRLFLNETVQILPAVKTGVGSVS